MATIQQLPPEALFDFNRFCYECGIRTSDLTEVLTAQINPDALYTSLTCDALSTPPQEGKTTWIAHYIAWQLIKNPKLNVIYASYSQIRANAVSRLIRSLVDRFTPLSGGTKNISQWTTRVGGGLLAAGRGTGVTGFSCDLLVIDDPIKNMAEAQSQLIRETTVEWFSSVLLTRMASLSHIIIVATRWHKDDLIAHAQEAIPDTRYTNIPAQAVNENDPLGRQPGEYLHSVQNRSIDSWNLIKAAVGTYVWQALYQGDPQVTGGSYINVDKIDVIPWDQVVFRDDNGFMQTLSGALVIQSWDLTFGEVPSESRRKKATSGDFVSGQVWARIGLKWIMIDRVHGRFTFTETVSQLQMLSARWPQTSRIYVEKAANGAALLDTLKKRAALIKAVPATSSKEARALAIQPTVDEGNVAVLDYIIQQKDGLAMMQEFRDFPFGAHDDDVDAMTQALTQGKADYYSMGN